MKNDKYRSLMVTPAFIGARARKFNHDCSQGRVIPLTPAKKASVLVEPLTTEFRPKTTANKEEDKPASRFKTTNSAPGRVRSYRGSENGEKKTLIGKHFLSWNIPGRVIGPGQQDTRKLPLKASHSVPAIISNHRKEKRWPVTPRTNSGERQRALALAQNKVTTLPQINPERKTSRRGSKEYTKEARADKDTDFTRKWLNKLDKEERSMAEDLLKAPSVNIDHSASVKPVLMWSSNATKKVSNASGGPSSTALSRESSRTNILYRTSSVAWRRDSTWLKPRNSTYQTWHGLPCFPVENETSNVAAAYMRPHRRIDPTFIIHPDWGCTT
eukprot:Seg42.5 transcript_id=Seg42.5/GoldUCD/mRNA.D3Y31 product="hypothetical protein" protein_id=Seg42.5/GoldUCD/D3Y31